MCEIELKMTIFTFLTRAHRRRFLSPTFLTSSEEAKKKPRKGEKNILAQEKLRSFHILPPAGSPERMIFYFQTPMTSRHKVEYFRNIHCVCSFRCIVWVGKITQEYFFGLIRWFFALVATRTSESGFFFLILSLSDEDFTRVMR